MKIHRGPEKLAPALVILLLAALATTPGCGGKSKGFAPVPPAPRTFYMGFSAIPPRPDFNVLLQSLQMWTLRADAAIMHTEPPWDSLLAGVPPETLIARDGVPLADYYHGLGLKIVYTVDATNGINRAGESQPLVDAGRSLTEPAIQMLYRRYVAAVDSMLHPDYLGSRPKRISFAPLRRPRSTTPSFRWPTLPRQMCGRSTPRRSCTSVYRSRPRGACSAPRRGSTSASSRTSRTSRS